MLWSLLKILIFISLVVGATYGVLFIIDNGGGVAISFGGREYAFSPEITLVALMLAMLVFWLALKGAGLLIAILKFFVGDETAISRFFDKSRERRGFAALADGMMALASGDGRTAQTKARKAEKLLNRPELTQLVNAQAAELAGDPKAAEEFFKGMLADNRTRFVGVHGLMRQRLAQGETETALKLAEKAFALKPRHGAVIDTLFSLQSSSEDWAGARKTLTAKMKSGGLTRDVAQRRDAVLSYADAEVALTEGKDDQARTSAIEANRLAPGLVPAAVLASQMQIKANAKRAATRVLTKAWGIAPHPDLAAAFAALEPEETPQARQKRFAPLVAAHPDHPEARMLQAELALAAEDFPGARKALGDLAETTPSTRAIAIMAAVARGEGQEDSVVRGWLAKAVTAPRGPQWTCTNCNHVHASWNPTCDNCGAFDTLDWIDPPADAEASANAAAMLPLLVGLVGDQNGTDPVADDNDRSDVVDVEATADADEAEATTADAESPTQKDKAEPA
ncbi:MAG: heme biosynthesis HemY N-terminal domain-containing protein [Pseudomonadota bacterium]